MKDYVLELVSQKETYDEKLNIMREYLQAYILKILHREQFFRAAAFVSGTALRFLYDLPRFSEDLDFSLDQKPEWVFEEVVLNVKKELELAQYPIAVKLKTKGNVQSAMIKFTGVMYEAKLSARKEQNFSIKVDLDTHPPKGAQTVTRLVNKYFPVSFYAYDLPSLFAGKMHALLTRKCIKGRDYFDFGWYISKWKNLEPNFVQLKNALKQTKWQGEVPSQENWKKMMQEVLEEADWQKVEEDVKVFLEQPGDLEMMSRENILALLQRSM